MQAMQDWCCLQHPAIIKTTIKDAIDNLEAGGSTAGGAGIQLAYKIAKENFVEKGNNRIILVYRW